MITASHLATDICSLAGCSLATCKCYEIAARIAARDAEWQALLDAAIGVPERNITLTNAQRRRLWVRWGGSEEEFADMLAGLGFKKPAVPVRGKAAP